MFGPPRRTLSAPSPAWTPPPITAPRDDGPRDHGRPGRSIESRKRPSGTTCTRTRAARSPLRSAGWLARLRSSSTPGQPLPRFTPIPARNCCVGTRAGATALATDQLRVDWDAPRQRVSGGGSSWFCGEAAAARRLNEWWKFPLNVAARGGWTGTSRSADGLASCQEVLVGPGGCELERTDVVAVAAVEAASESAVEVDDVDACEAAFSRDGVCAGVGDLGHVAEHAA